MTCKLDCPVFYCCWLSAPPRRWCLHSRTSKPHESIYQAIPDPRPGASASLTDKKKPDQPASSDAEIVTDTGKAAVNADPLLRVLVNKGLLTADEARAIVGGGTPGEQHDRLAALLRDKGLISDTEFAALRAGAQPPVRLRQPTQRLPSHRQRKPDPVAPVHQPQASSRQTLHRSLPRLRRSDC
jgi:hypothetical protein